VNDDDMPDKEKVKELIVNNGSSYDNTDGICGSIVTFDTILLFMFTIFY
jgi:hypothetical protein